MTLTLKNSQEGNDGIKRIGTVDSKLATSIVPTSDYMISRIEALFEPENGATGNIHLEVFSDNGSGSPNTLIATSPTSIDITTVVAPTWLAFDFTPFAVTNGTRIHAAAHGDDPGGNGFGAGDVKWTAATAIGEFVNGFDGSWGIENLNTQLDFRTYADEGAVVLILQPPSQRIGHQLMVSQ